MINSFTPIKHFYAYCQPLIPLAFEQAWSFEELLYKVLYKMNETITQLNNLGEISENHSTLIQELQTEFTLLSNEFEKVKNGDYVSLYINQLSQWIDANLQELVGRVVKYVFFGLTDDGYFCAYIPQSWEFIEFDTIVQPDSPMYGHLVLRW